jgi:hypothetical protein|tara:strand:+ start:595 stop:777 length:183 start_codon:yes stop_codon:yes gene_type:complete
MFRLYRLLRDFYQNAGDIAGSFSNTPQHREHLPYSRESVQSDLNDVQDPLGRLIRNIGSK